eukprot:1919647-Rhodomonas_salina.3
MMGPDDHCRYLSTAVAVGWTEEKGWERAAMEGEGTEPRSSRLHGKTTRRETLRWRRAVRAGFFKQGCQPPNFTLALSSSLLGSSCSLSVMEFADPRPQCPASWAPGTVAEYGRKTTLYCTARSIASDHNHRTLCTRKALACI